MFVREFNAKHRAGQNLGDDPFHFNMLFFRFVHSSFCYGLQENEYLPADRRRETSKVRKSNEAAFNDPAREIESD